MVYNDSFLTPLFTTLLSLPKSTGKVFNMSKSISTSVAPFKSAFVAVGQI